MTTQAGPSAVKLFGDDNDVHPLELARRRRVEIDGNEPASARSAKRRAVPFG
jgi:hypothetical protein